MPNTSPTNSGLYEGERFAGTLSERNRPFLSRKYDVVRGGGKSLLSDDMLLSLKYRAVVLDPILSIPDPSRHRHVLDRKNALVGEDRASFRKRPSS